MGKQRDNHYLQEIQKIVFSVLGSYPVEVYLFGSWAEGRVTQSSDVDIAVLSKKHLPLGLLPRLREELEESRVPYDVEVVDLNRSDPLFRKTVLKEGIRWTN